jgi:signal peptidase I
MGTLAIRRFAGKTFRDWIPSLLLIVLMLVARSTLADHYVVPSGSMEFALVPGDHVLVNKAAYGLRVPFTKHVFSSRDEPHAGDVVIFDSPVSDVRLIKRVVAVGGDHVVLHDGKLRVNGRELSPSPFSEVENIGEKPVHLNLDDGGGPDIDGLIVPEGHVLVLGDHRGNSRDGRYFGTVPVSELYGRAVGVFWRDRDGPGWHSL